MIKVQFFTDARDICSIIEGRVTDGVEVEDWILQHIDGISFDSMDYPCDMDFCYDCYFLSGADELKAQEIYGLLEKYFLDILGVRFSVGITDHCLNNEIRIHSARSTDENKEDSLDKKGIAESRVKLMQEKTP